MSLGFEATPANLLTVPVYVLAGIWTCTVGFLADRYGRRGYFTMFVTVLLIAIRKSLTLFCVFKAAVSP